MKKIILTYFLLFYGFTMISQAPICGTKSNSESIEYLIKNKLNRHSISRSDETIYIPLVFHLVADSDGNGRIPFDVLLNQLCVLNESYAPYNYKFYLKNSTVNNVDDNTIYDNPRSSAAVIKMAAQKSEFGANAINIFVTNNAGGEGSITTLGYYSFNTDWIVMKKSSLQNDNQDHFVLGHEIGHFFTLDHTFRGWDQEPWDGNPITSNLSPGGVLNELVDGSNCEVAGDLICDTPADYNLGLGWDGCTPYDGGCKDINGDFLDPQENNFMGYFIGCQNYEFSAEQAEIIDADYISPRRAYLRVSYTPEDLEIEDRPILVSPQDDEVTPFYNGVELSWSAVENASRYFVEITRGLFKFNYIVSENKLFLTDLEEDKLYRWRVIPFNETDGCAGSSELWAFRTGQNTTNTFETEIINEIQIKPNPLVSGPLGVKVNNNYMGPVEIRIFNINGNLLFTEQSQKNKIQQEFKLYQNLSPGIYVLNIKFGFESKTEKLVINE